MKCSVCGTDIMKKPLFRANIKGQPAIWKCEYCIDINNIPTGIKEIVDIINNNK